MPRSPFLDLPGAVEFGDSGVAAHYGNPLVEQRRLLAGAIVDLSHRGVVLVSGPDRLRWLDSMLSQDVAGLRPGESRESLLLSAQGRVEHALRVTDDGSVTWILVDEGEAGALAQWLSGMRFMMQVEVRDAGEEYATVGWRSETPPDGIDPVVVWTDPWREGTPYGHTYATTRPSEDEPWTWHEGVIPREDLPALAGRAASGELGVAGLLALEALRIAAWRPRLATEGDDRLLPHEVDWLRSAVHLSKGCYRGQETVAKVHNLGHPPRRLVFLHLDGSESALPGTGDPVLDATETEIGHVTAAALHHELGPIALALVKRTADVTAPLVVVLDSTRVAASQEVVVPADAGSAVAVPRLPRLGAKRR